MNWSLNPQANPVALGSNGRSAVITAWFSNGSFARSVNRGPKLWLSVGESGFPVIPASIQPYILNRGSGGLGGSTIFFTSLPSGVGDAVTSAPKDGKL